MGITIGDALTVIAIVAALGFSLWASSLAFGLIFSERSGRAMARVAEAPGKTFGLGLVGGLAWVSVAIVLNSIPNPLTKLAALAVVGTLACVAALGLSGVARLMAERITGMDPGFSPFMAFVRGATLMSLGMIMPLLGWFFVGPVVTVMGIGAGIASLGKAKQAVVAPSASEGV